MYDCAFRLGLAQNGSWFAKHKRTCMSTEGLGSQDSEVKGNSTLFGRTSGNVATTPALAGGIGLFRSTTLF